MTIADKVRADANPFHKAIALFCRREDKRYKVTFYFCDGSSISFKKVYELEN